jgi:hypothetical protein
MIKILFLMAFIVHNIEEGLWLPSWSLHAKKFHPVVTNREMHFALFGITIIGFLITAVSYMFGRDSLVVEGLYFGFVAAMVLNVIFLHLVACAVLRRYAPGTLTGFFLILPIGGWLLFLYTQGMLPKLYMAGGTVAAAVVLIALLKPLFWLGRKLINE